MKKFISLFTTLCIVFGALGAFTVFAAENGTYKDTMMWTLDDNGVLTISGTGVVARDPQDETPLPWDESRSSITQIVLGEGITGVEGEWTFMDTPNLRSVTFPESITVIGYESFAACPALTSVTIPKNVKEIGERAFGYCSGLVSINVDEDNPYYSSADGILYNKDKTELIQYPIGKSDTAYTIPESVTRIGDNAFMYDSNLTSIIIPDTVKSINYNAFYYCENLTDITIGSGVTEIGWCAFDGTAYYNDETKWDNDVLYIGDYLIDAKDGISGDYEIKSGTRVIADNTFSYCRDLTGVTIPDSVTSIGENAFNNCDKITDIVIPYGITKISEDMFAYCTNLASVTIPDSVKSIEDGAFYLCNKLTAVDIPNSVTKIGDNAFLSCSLTSITIPSGVTSIGNSAFAGCELTEINVDTGNPNYISEDGILFNKEKTKLICYPSEKEGTSYTIPNSVITIEKSAFYNCKSLTEITVPDSVKSIGDRAFYYCSGLTEFTIPDSVTEIGGSAFADCRSLESIVIGENVKSISHSMFDDCYALVNVTIPDSVTYIDDYAFYYCKNLESVIIGSGVTSIGFCAFHNCSKLKDIYYHGAQSDFEKISIDDNNSPLATAEKHYDYVPPIPTVTKISTLAQLEAFRDSVNGGNTYEGKIVKLTADIDMSEKYGEGKESWTPIGIFDWENPMLFSGTFDGGGHTIGGLYINTEADWDTSLFAIVDGTVQNLNVQGYVLTTHSSGCAAGIVQQVGENGKILDCSFDGVVESRNYAAAGIASANLGMISDCKFSGKVIGWHLTGAIASNGGEESIIKNCINEGEIMVDIGGGGIVGWGNRIENCVNAGKITGISRTMEGCEPETSWGVGGIAGVLAVGGVIENCYNTGEVSGNTEVGGIIGTAEEGWTENWSLAKVKNCYNIGKVTLTMEKDGEHNIGAIIGNREYILPFSSEENDTTTLTSEAVNCYYLVGTADKGCGGNAEDTATVLTSEQFADEIHFTNWDFDTVWKMDETLSRPVLRSNTEAADEIIEISTLAQLEAFRDSVNDGNTYEGKTVRLTADIDMSEKYGEGKESWTPIGISDYENSI